LEQWLANVENFSQTNFVLRREKDQFHGGKKSQFSHPDILWTLKILKVFSFSKKIFLIQKELKKEFFQKKFSTKGKLIIGCCYKILVDK